METAHLLRLLSLFTVLQQVRSWSINVPKTITATEGSCVVVPCQTEPHDRVIWYKYHKVNYPVVCDERNLHTVEPQLRGRTSVVGSASKGNCTLMIDDVKAIDNNLKVYVWINPELKAAQKFYDQTITVSVERKYPILSVQRQIVEGEILEANCSLKHSCPSLPPSLNWSKSPFLINSSFRDFTSEAGGQWLYRKSLSGIVTRAMQDSKIKCSAQFRRFTTQSQEITLNILYKPVSVVLILEKTEVMEGDSITVKCSANSNPPTHTYSWTRRHLGKESQTNSTENTLSFNNIKRDTSLSCMAHNNIGEGQSDWHDLKVQYAPVILPESSCSQKGDILQCLCLSDASPNASISWITDGNDNIPLLFNSTSTRKRNVMCGEIHVPVNIQMNISCTAWNQIGNDTKQLHMDFLSRTSFLSLLWLMLLGIALLLACAMWIYKKYPRERSQPSFDNIQKEERYGPLPRSTDEGTYQNVQRPERDPEEDGPSCIYDNDFIEDMQRSAMQQQNNPTPQNKGDDIQLLAKVK